MRGTHLGEWMGIKPAGKPIEVTAVNVDRVAEPLLQIGAVRVAT